MEQAQQHPAAKMVAQLDLLLVKAARNSTSSLTGSTVKRTLQKLVDDGALDSNSLKALEKAGNTAAKTFKALADFTGRQLAEAVAVKAPAAGGGAGAAAIPQAPQWTIKENTPAGKTIAAAIKAQQDLSDLLAQLTKGLDVLVRHDAEVREANPQYRGVDAAVYEKVKDFRLRCDRRATEISELTFQMKEFAMNLPANARDADPNVDAILRAKVSSLLPRQAIAMHDTPDALATANRDIAARLRPVAEKIDAFQRNPTVTIARNELADLQTELATMKAALGSIRRDGVEVQGGRLLVPTDIVKALEDEVGKVEIQFRTARKEVLETILRNYLQTAADLYSMPGAIEDACSRDSRKASQMLERRNEFFVALDQLAAALVALKEGPQRQAYLDSIRPRLSEASYDAAVSRLDDVIAHAERLRRENKVIEADAWAAVEETRLPTGKLTTHKLDGTEKRHGGTIATEAHKSYRPSIYARDGFEKLFR